ncbi:hypothetical protein [Pseudomonas savastanoi]|uniref:hypothetical protein n=1 Tax=Pseudomonas savastanoi TaxID=29438 RepID=UPI00070E154A|nr:hypothetical protein [Pseudomonas savastanoi]KWT09189.1 hypothetical protein AL047_17415 [Pseudomonas syringae pv. broussonetiae]
MNVLIESEEARKTKEKALENLNQKGIFNAGFARGGLSLFVKLAVPFDKKKFSALALRLKPITKAHSLSPRFNEGFRVDNHMVSLNRLSDVSDEIIEKLEVV